MKSEFNCERCGWCCKNIVINVGYSDIIRWFNAGRDDILQEVSYINNYPRARIGGFYIAKTAFNPKQPCPFLTKENLCGIYDTRCGTCKDFPYGHSKVKECPGWTTDLNEEKSQEIIQRQSKDFRLAHNQRATLLKILKEARMNG